MNLYQWKLLISDIVTEVGTIHAMTEEGADARIKAEALPKYIHDNYVIHQLKCSCGSYNDVTAYYMKDKRYIECVDCRHEKH